MRPTLAKQRDADDADIVRTPGARRIGIGEAREVERGDLVEILAPALDPHRVPGAEYVTALLLCCCLAADDVDPVDARHGEQAACGRIADAQLVLMTRLACDIKSPLVLVDRQSSAGGAVVDLEVCQCARVGSGSRERRYEGGQGE